MVRPEDQETLPWKGQFSVSSCPEKQVHCTGLDHLWKHQGQSGWKQGAMGKSLDCGFPGTGRISKVRIGQCD